MKALTPDELRYFAALKRHKAVLDARDKLIPFARFMKPDPNHPDDVAFSTYEIARHHEVIAHALEAVERGEIRRLIINCPPRHGKSELASRLFPAWYVGKHPGASLISASYNEKFSWDFGREVRMLLEDGVYRQIFPGVLIHTASVDRIETESGAKLFFTGRGGSITGRGANCFPAGTKILTSQGEVNIETLAASSDISYVLSYADKTDKLCWSPIEAVSARKADGLRRITTSAGRVVFATPEHPFRVGRRWTSASELAPGDDLVCAMRTERGEAGVRDCKTRKAGVGALLLLRSLFVPAQKRCAIWAATLSDLWGTSAKGGLAQRLHLLFGGMQGVRAAAAFGGNARTLAPVHVFGMQHGVRSPDGGGSIGIDALLQQPLRRSSTFPPNVGEGQSEVEKRGYPASEAAAFGKSVSRYARVGAPTRWTRLRRVWEQVCAFGSPPHRQLADEQRRDEPGDVVLGAPSSVAFGNGFELVPDSVAVVERVREEAVVYDLQVGGTHNFFANGILVHNCLLIDDPLKDRVEADSPTTREKLWSWFNQVVRTRLLTSKGCIVVISTRWHEDDLVGRLTDPTNASYNVTEARKWRIIDLPAIAREDDVLGRKPGEALWPSRFPVDYLEDLREADPRGFQSLYQGSPTPDKGNFFMGDRLRTYRPDEMPPKEEMRFYAASDHAVSLAQDRDKTCLMVVGIDKDKNLWVMPDVIWGRYSTDVVVERMIDLMRKYKPMYWWAERGHISKSIGPFLRQRQVERDVFCSIVEVTPVHDKKTRAQAIGGRIAMSMVYFPSYAPWWAEARDELLKFPHGSHDDFVDTLAWIGLGLNLQNPPRPARAKDAAPKVGTLGWVKAEGRRALSPASGW